MKVTSSWIQDFESNVSTHIVGAYENAARELFWDAFMVKKQSSGKREIIVWLLETAQLYDRGNGGNTRIDEIASHYFEIINKRFGASLNLTDEEIQDNQMANVEGMSALDYATHWSQQMGALAAIHPQTQMFNLLAQGESATGYDGVPFFSTAHPVNGIDASHGTYSNLFTGATYDLIADVGQNNYGKSEQALNDALAAIRNLKLPNGMPRRLKPRALLVPPSKALVAQRLTGAALINATNNVSTGYALTPYIADELSAAPDEWYIACELIGDKKVGPLVYQERKPYELTSYSMYDDAFLNRQKAFEWDFDGRNATAFGHPFMMFKFKKA